MAESGEFEPYDFSECENLIEHSKEIQERVEDEVLEEAPEALQSH